jgi:spore germination protein YaaH
MKFHHLSFLKFLFVVLLVLLLPVTVFISQKQQQIQQNAAGPTIYTIYADALSPNWHNGSGTDSTINFSTISPVYSGSYAMSFIANKPFAGMYLYSDTPVDTIPYTSLQFALQASQANQRYTIAFYDTNERPLTAPISLAKYGGNPVVGKWKLYTIPLTDLKAQITPIKAFLLQSQSTHAQPAVYVDSLQLIGVGSAVSYPKTATLPTSTSAPALTPTPTPLATWSSHAMAWIYPGSPACNAPNEYKDGRHIDTLKPQYFTLDSTGTLVQLTTATNGCNAYSPANAAEIKQYSTHQYVTISGDTASMNALITNQTKINSAITTIKNFLGTVQFTGAEIDFEGFAQWTPQQYTSYKNFLTRLGNTLHQSGYKLMVDGPGDIDVTSSYQWHYADFNSLPVDYIVVMEYDWQYDYGAGTPVAPLAREQNVTKTVMGEITDSNKIVVGIPSYGYHGKTGGYTLTIDTNTQLQAYPGYTTATRDSSSAEMMFTNSGISYDYADSQTLNTKRTTIESLGIKNISVWHLGGNQWFSGKAEPH